MMLLHREWKDVGITRTWLRGMTSGGTNLPAAEAGVTRWCESKSSDTGLKKESEGCFCDIFAFGNPHFRFKS